MKNKKIMGLVMTSVMAFSVANFRTFTYAEEFKAHEESAQSVGSELSVQGAQAAEAPAPAENSVQKIEKVAMKVTLSCYTDQEKELEFLWGFKAKGEDCYSEPIKFNTKTEQTEDSTIQLPDGDYTKEDIKDIVLPDYAGFDKTFNDANPVYDEASKTLTYEVVYTYNPAKDPSLKDREINITYVVEDGFNPFNEGIKVELYKGSDKISEYDSTVDNTNNKKASYDEAGKTVNFKLDEAVINKDDYKAEIYCKHNNAWTKVEDLYTVNKQTLQCSACLAYEIKPYFIGDYVWFDENKNGIQDADEKGVAGVSVSLKKDDGTTETTMTDKDGKYYFTKLYNGTYTVTFSIPTGYEATKTAAGEDRAKDSNGMESEVIINKADDLTIDLGLIGISPVPPVTPPTPDKPVPPTPIVPPTPEIPSIPGLPERPVPPVPPVTPPTPEIPSVPENPVPPTPEVPETPNNPTPEKPDFEYEVDVPMPKTEPKADVQKSVPKTGVQENPLMSIFLILSIILVSIFGKKKH